LIAGTGFAKANSVSVGFAVVASFTIVNDEHWRYSFDSWAGDCRRDCYEHEWSECDYIEQSVHVLLKITAGYSLMGAKHLNGGGKPDYVLYNASTRQTAICYMNNYVRVGAAYGPTLPGGWSLVAP
jgi:hypothetical protein